MLALMVKGLNMPAGGALGGAGSTTHLLPMVGVGR